MLSLENHDELTELFDYVERVRKKYVGNEVLSRGLVEFSNYCRNSCFYCGQNRYNTTLKRYRLDDKHILDAVKKCGEKIKTVVLQSGQDENLDVYWLRDLIKEIKTGFDIAVTLSVGEKKYEDYKLWKDAGADRYLLKIETTDKELYNSLHYQGSFENV